MNPHQFTKLFDMVLDMKDDQAAMKTLLEKNTVVLEEHSRRSTASEQRQEILEKRHEEFEKRFYLYDGLFKIAMTLLTAAGIVIGIVYTIRQLL
jgi:hypothetical protein